MNQKLTLEYISDWLNENKPEFKLAENNIYKGNNTKLILYHDIPTCKEYFEITWANLYKGKGCGVCSGRQVKERNSLLYLNYDLSLEWHPNNNISPQEVTVSSSKEVYWICSKCGYGQNKEWKSAISTRNKGIGCPSCSGRVVSDKNRLSILFPEIAKEWHPTKNGNLSPDDVSYGIARKVWWTCSDGHEYFSSINGRTNGGFGCKFCSDIQKESKIATELKHWCKENFQDVDIEHPMMKNPKGRILKCDIYLGEENTINGVYIEVNGGQHYTFHSRYHKSKQYFEDSKYRDELKKTFAKKHGRYIEIDLRKIKTIDDAIEYLFSKLNP